MTVDEILHIFVEFPPKFFESDLQKQCVKTILASGLSKDQVTRVIPPSLSNFILKQLSEADAKVLLSSMQISNLKISETEKKFSCEILRELLRLHVQVLTIENCTIPSKLLGTHDLISLQSFSSKLKTLIMNDIYISMHDEKFIKAFGTSMEHIVNFRFGAVSSCDSIHQSDEIFTRLARDHLSKNRFLAHIDLRGSDVDLMATSSRRNILINFAAEMRRWARRLRSLAFDSDVNVCRIFRILNRQCSLLKSLCLRTRGQRTVSDAFDNLKSILETTDLKFKKVEPLPKLTRLCLNGHFRVTDSILKFILPSLNSLQFLNISGCPVNFEHYWHYLPASLEELIVDKCSRLEFIAEHRSSLKQVFQKCKRLKIYVVMSIFKGEDLESLKGLALLNGADSLLSDQINSIAEQSDDGLIGFELRVKELKNCSNWGCSRISFPRCLMYGIPDLEKEISELPDSEITSNLSVELGRIPWHRERDELLPKPFGKQKFVYESDFLSDILIEQQERGQAFIKKFTNKFGQISRLYNETVDKIENRLDDRDLVPSIGLASIASLVAWRGNKTSPLPLKFVYSTTGALLTVLITHEKFRNYLRQRMSAGIPENIKEKVRAIDGMVGQFGAGIWRDSDDLFEKFKSKLMGLTSRSKK